MGRLAIFALSLSLIAPVSARSFDLQEVLRGLEGTTRLAQRWEELTPAQRQRALRNYQRYRSLPPEQRESVERRYERWKRLAPGEKERYRERYRDLLGGSDED
jgi:hypothetical protein